MDYGNLNETQRFEFINSKVISSDVFNYLSNKFNSLTIEVACDYAGNIMELMQRGVLEGWCWETTDTAILFLNDDAYIQRGNLKFDKKKYYYHSWIVFDFDGADYVFDPCLQILCEKDIYDTVFEIEVMGKVTAKQVREYFIEYITNPPKEKLSKEEEERKARVHEMFVRILGEDFFERKKGEIVVYDKEDVNAPMYRNGVGYKTELENGKIKKLVAHYYINA